MVMYLGEDDIRGLLDWEPLIAAMEAVLAGFSIGRAIQPVREMLTIEEGRRYLGVMPAVTEDVMGAKLVGFYPGNAGSGIPTHHAMILLFRTDTGEPLAAMDGRLITEMHTAAVSAAATRHLARADSRVLALLGSGVQAEAHLHALQRVRSFEKSACGAARQSTRSALPTVIKSRPCPPRTRFAAPMSSSPRRALSSRSSEALG